MSDTPTATQIDDLRRDVGDELETTFTDAEIERLWYRVRGAADAVQQHEATLALMYRQLMANASKLVDQRVGDVDEKLSQLRKNLQAMYMLYEPALLAAQGTQLRQFAKSAVRGKPRQNRTFPADRSYLEED